jgi:hypothetical protein
MILQLIYTATQFTAPILLPFLLDFITQGVYPVDDLTHRTIPGWHGYVYSAAIVVPFSFITHHFEAGRSVFKLRVY